MKKLILIIALLALGTGGCGGGSGLNSPVKLAEGLDPSVDTVENECAFFYFTWGRTAELDGKLEEAREAYEKALVCDLHAVHVMRRLAVLLINMNKKKDAANWVKRILEEDPEDSSSSAFLANLYVSMDQPEDAEKVYLGILKKNPEDTDNMLQLGALYARQKKYDEAEKLLENLVNLNPDSFIGHQYLAKVYEKTGKVEKARKSFNEALNLNWTSFMAFEVAVFLGNNGYEIDALKLYREILEEDESNERIRTTIISILLRMDKVDKAIEEFEALLPFATDVLKVEVNLSRLLIDRKKYDEAIEHLNSVLDNDPDFSEARILLALALYEKGEEDEAVANLKKVGSDDDDYEDSTAYLVRILVSEKELSMAERILKDRIGVQESRRKSFYPLLATVLHQQGKSSEAGKIFEEALRLYPDDRELLLEHALFQDEQGFYDRALITMQQVLVIKADDPYALNYIAYSWAEQGENLDKALSYVKKALEVKPEDGFIRDSLGWILFKMGRNEEALAELIKSREIEAEDPTINEHVGDVYFELGRVSQALASWKKALRLQQDEEKKEHLSRKIEAVAD